MAYDKVVDSAVLNAGLTQIANAIREKAGTSDSLAFPAAMAEAIAAIEAGGGELSYVEGTFSLAENTQLHEVTHNLGKIPKIVLLTLDNYNAGNPYAMSNNNPSLIATGYANECAMTIHTTYNANAGVNMGFHTKTGADITNSQSDLGCAISNATVEKITFGYHPKTSATNLRNIASYRYIIGG